MDPLTHGIAGALIGKAFFAEQRAGAHSEDKPKAGQAWRPVLLLTLGALFPDVDFIFQVFSKSTVATLEYHRWITHSLVCLPGFAILLALGMRGALRLRRHRREGGARVHQDRIEDDRAGGLSRWALLFGAGIASHIFLDVITSWGTIVLAPLSRTRPAWDWVFILDSTLTGVMLVPQVLAWVYRDESKAAARRRMKAWLGLCGAAIALQQFSSALGVPFSLWALAAVIVALAAVIFGPALVGWGSRISSAQWCRTGFAATAVYLLLCFAAQRAALARVQDFARECHIPAQNIAALPLPPSLARWAGMIRTATGVHQTTFSLFDSAPPQFEFIADRVPPESLEAAQSLREVQTFLWFARFPVVETREEGGQRVVVFTDRRFVQRWASAPAPFEYWVVFDAAGNVTQQGWAQVILMQRQQEKR